MTGLRLSLALDSGGLIVPQDGRIAVFAPGPDADLSALPSARCQVITTMRPTHDQFTARGLACATAPEGRYGAALVCVPRARHLAEDLVAQAVAVTDGPVIVDGQKTDGIESMLKACRARADVSAPISKAHGKLFWFSADAARFADWRRADSQPIEGGFVTAPGVFSADGIDPGSRLLAEHLPAGLGAHVVDLGAGWGYLAAKLLEDDRIARLDLVEADHAALGCAERNVTDPRAQFHWADALTWQPETRADAVVMNPPFHTGRSADPGLGRRFVVAAAGLLKPAGQLWLVANRHLPYESTLAEYFAEAAEMAGDTRFKILRGRRPRRPKR